MEMRSEELEVRETRALLIMPTFHKSRYLFIRPGDWALYLDLEVDLSGFRGELC
jgi:hypothetical protein